MKTKLEEIEKIIEKRGEFTVLDGAAKITVSFAPNDDSGYFIRTHYVVDYYDDMTPYLDGMREPLMKPSGCEGEPENILNWIEDFIKTIKKEEK